MKVTKTKKIFKKRWKKLAKLYTKHTRAYKRKVRGRRYLLYGVVIMASCLSVYLYISSTHTPNSRLVTFHDRGQNHVILTTATTVRGALQDAHISVDPKDDVEPALDSQLTSTDAAVIIYRARLVHIVDGAREETVLTPAQSPNEIATAAGIDPIGLDDKTAVTKGEFITSGAGTILTISRAAPPPAPAKVAFAPTAQTLTKSKGAQLYTDASGVTHRETYYDLPMNIVITACGPGDYTIRSDGAKVDKDGYVLVAASYRVYPRCTVVETSMGPGKVYDTGGFALRYPHGFDLATDWTNYDGR